MFLDAFEHVRPADWQDAVRSPEERIAWLPTNRA